MAIMAPWWYLWHSPLNHTNSLEVFATKTTFCWKIFVNLTKIHDFHVKGAARMHFRFLFGSRTGINLAILSEGSTSISSAARIKTNTGISLVAFRSSCRATVIQFGLLFIGAPTGKLPSFLKKLLTYSLTLFLFFCTIRIDNGQEWWGTMFLVIRRRNSSLRIRLQAAFVPCKSQRNCLLFLEKNQTGYIQKHLAFCRIYYCL